MNTGLRHADHWNVYRFLRWAESRIAKAGYDYSVVALLLGLLHREYRRQRVPCVVVRVFNRFCAMVQGGHRDLGILVLAGVQLFHVGAVPQVGLHGNDDFDLLHYPVPP